MSDVFLSYAHADDQTMADNAKGWVTAFASRLQKSVAMKPGGSKINIWMDHGLEPQRAVDAALAQRIGKSSCLVAVMSPRYLESEWCFGEMRAFLADTAGGSASDRVFLVEMAPTDRERWHPGVRSITALKFWSQEFDDAAPIPLGWPVPDPSGDRAYWRALNELAHFLSAQISEIASSTQNEGSMRRVWIADPTDHVLDQWDRLAAALRQHGCEIVPAAPGAYALGSQADFVKALAADLARADLLVQLFGPHPGRKPFGSPTSASRLQADAARARAENGAVPLMVWRDPAIRLEQIADASFRELLTGAIASGFEDFVGQVLNRLTVPPPIVAPATPAMATRVDNDIPLTICVSADAADRELGERVRDLLFGLGVDASLAPAPAADQPPVRWRHEYETMLGESQGLVILHGQSPPSWVQAQAHAAKKALARGRHGIWGALLDVPPGTQPDHGVRSHSMMMIDCRAGLVLEPFERFIETLRAQVVQDDGRGSGG